VFVVAAAAIHLIEAMNQSMIITTGLLLWAGAQAGAAIGLIARPNRRSIAATTLVQTAALVLWFVAHSIGLPLPAGVWQPEMTTIAAYLSPVVELFSLGLLVLAALHGATQQSRGFRTVMTIAAILVATFLARVDTMFSGADAWLLHGAPAPPVPGGTATLAYCHPDGLPLAMDLTEPASAAPRPAPAVVYIHGGGWFMGDRQLHRLLGNPFAGDPSFAETVNQALTQRGYVVASFDYRLAPLYPAPAQLEDAKCAIRFLRANATTFGIDPARIGVYGESAGGNLTALLGTVGPAAGYDVGEYADQSSAVEAAVDLYGPTELTDPAFIGTHPIALLAHELDYGSSMASATAASPLDYVSNRSAPFLVLHGADDTFLPPLNSRAFSAALQSAGVSAELVMVQHTGHSMTTPGQLPATPTVESMMADFFASTLDPRPVPSR
jgi:acetyl esterase/lipase